MFQVLKELNVKKHELTNEENSFLNVYLIKSLNENKLGIRQRTIKQEDVKTHIKVIESLCEKGIVSKKDTQKSNGKLKKTPPICYQIKDVFFCKSIAEMCINMQNTQASENKIHISDKRELTIKNEKLASENEDLSFNIRKLTSENKMHISDKSLQIRKYNNLAMKNNELENKTQANYVAPNSDNNFSNANWGKIEYAKPYQKNQCQFLNSQLYLAKNL